MLGGAAGEVEGVCVYWGGSDLWGGGGGGVRVRGGRGGNED